MSLSFKLLWYKCFTWQNTGNAMCGFANTNILQKYLKYLFSNHCSKFEMEYLPINALLKPKKERGSLQPLSTQNFLTSISISVLIIQVYYNFIYFCQVWFCTWGACWLEHLCFSGRRSRDMNRILSLICGFTLASD